MRMNNGYDDLRAWYLASLRRRVAQDVAPNLTPMSLVRADAGIVEQLILERSQKRTASVALPANRNVSFATSLSIPATRIAIVLGAVSVAWLLGMFFLLNQEPAPITLIRVMCFIAIAGITAACFGIWWLFKKNVISRLNEIRELAKGELDNQYSVVAPNTDSELDFVFMLVQRLCSAHSQSVERERAIADYSPHLICSVDKKGRLLAVSPGSENLLGYGPHEMSGGMLMRYVFEEDVPATLKHFNSSAKDQASARFEARMRRKDGQTMHAAWSIEWSETQQLGYCVAQDVTHINEMAALKREFVAMITHDLRSPISALVANTRLLQLGVVGEMSAEALIRLKSMQKSGERLMALVNELLEIERAECGKMELERSTVSVEKMLESVRDAIQSLAESKKIKLLCGSCDTNFLGDERRLTQVLINLVSNAIKFSPANETIRIDVACDAGQIEFRVSDNGRGIPAEDCAKVFDRFKQVEMQDSTISGGSGLGLAICKGIVDAHGGSIGVQSQQGVGSTFWFRVPLEIVDPLGAAPTQDSTDVR